MRRRGRLARSGHREVGAGRSCARVGLVAALAVRVSMRASRFDEPGLELVGRHVVGVVGRLADGGRDSVGELRVGTGVGEAAGDRVGEVDPG